MANLRQPQNLSTAISSQVLLMLNFNYNDFVDVELIARKLSVTDFSFFFFVLIKTEV